VPAFDDTLAKPPFEVYSKQIGGGDELSEGLVPAAPSSGKATSFEPALFPAA
jgi:hypothetical protein